MTDTTLHGTLSEILQHHEEMVGHQLTLIIHKDDARLEKLILEGLKSPMEDIPLDEWKSLRDELDANLSEKN